MISKKKIIPLSMYLQIQCPLGVPSPPCVLGTSQQDPGVAKNQGELRCFLVLAAYYKEFLLQYSCQTR